MNEKALLLNSLNEYGRRKQVSIRATLPTYLTPATLDLLENLMKATGIYLS